MDPVRLLQITFDILSLTSILVLLVLGMGVIVGMMGVFNFAHGELVLLGALTTYLAVQSGLSAWIGILLAPIVVGVVGLALERSVVRRLYGLPLAALLATWGVGLIIREVVRAYLGTAARSIPYPLGGNVEFGALSIPQWRLFVLLVTIVIVVASYLVLQRTRLGLLVRATLENPDLARASGVRTSRIYTLTFAFGSALAGLAGALIVPLTSLYAELGLVYLIRSFLGVMVGGMGSFDGPVAGALTVGVSGGVLPWIVAPVTADILVFVFAIALMRFRPQGLRGNVA